MKSFILLFFFIFGACAPVLATPVGASFPRDEFLEIQKGHRAGHTIIQKFGHNPDVDTATVPEDIWENGGVYTGFPSEREKLEILSSSVADAEAGTGCRTIVISGLDSNFDQVSETIIMNGTTVVESVNIYSRMNRSYCASSGSGTTNAGTITIRHTTTTANVFGSIAPSDGQTHIACYTIPRNHTGYIMANRVGMYDSTANRATISYFVKSSNGTTSLVRPISVSTTAPVTVSPVGGFIFPEKTDGCARATIVDNNNGNIQFSFDIVLRKNGS